jgi:hypothetical protein
VRKGSTTRHFHGLRGGEHLADEARHAARRLAIGAPQTFEQPANQVGRHQHGEEWREGDGRHQRIDAQQNDDDADDVEADAPDINHVLEGVADRLHVIAEAAHRLAGRVRQPMRAWPTHDPGEHIAAQQRLLAKVVGEPGDNRRSEDGGLPDAHARHQRHHCPDTQIPRRTARQRAEEPACHQAGQQRRGVFDGPQCDIDEKERRIVAHEPPEILPGRQRRAWRLRRGLALWPVASLDCRGCHTSAPS